MLYVKKRSNMNEQELNAYRARFAQKFGEPHVRRVVKEGFFKNAERTGDRSAYGGISWIDYWRAMTGNHATTLHCSSCGKEIVVGLSALLNPENQAIGGHIWLTAPAGADWQGGRFITPLCPACNAKRGEQIPLKEDSILCKELGAN